MKRRVQGLCLLLLGALFGWLAGSELATTASWPWVVVLLVLALAMIFLGLILAFGIAVWPDK